MFSKSLFKQSCKAHGMMWSIITFAVCFMLACVMLIAGGSSISDTKNAIQDTIIEGELTSQIESRSINYYTTSDKALEFFDDRLIANITVSLDSEEANKAYQDAIAQGMGFSEAYQLKIKTGVEIGYKQSIIELMEYKDKLIAESGYSKDSMEAKEIEGLIFMTLNPMVSEDTYMFDEFYINNGEEAPRYDILGLLDSSLTMEKREMYRKDYAFTNSSIFLAGNLILEENVEKILLQLSNYGVTFQKYEDFGFTDYSKIKNIASTALVDFRANFAYRMENIQDGETEASITEELTKDITSSLLASLPREVSEALDEIGQSDLYGTLVGSIFFKMAGLLLPIIYMIMTANSLIAGQVDSGSMAYILSTSTKRKTVTFTQAVYLVGSLFAMFLCTSIVSCVCLAIVDVDTSLTFGKLLLINLGAFIVMFAMSGICFLASCFFNRSKRSMAIGGGLTMFFLVATMLGLFGSPIIPSIVRMEALNAFNYVSIISLFDVISILEGSTTYLWKLAILVVGGVVCYFVGSKKFERKDLPL